MLKIIHKSPGNFVFEDVPEPELKNGEALVEVKSVGICADEIYTYQGKHQDILPLPAVEGHEFGGIVKEIKGESKKIKIGDKVAVFPLIFCGSCYYCTHGLEIDCGSMNYFGTQMIEGGMQEKIAVPIDSCLKLSEDFDIRYASLVEPVTVANHTVGKVKDSNIIINGVGSIGMAMVEIAKAHNNRVIAVDIDEGNLKIAKKLKADLVLNSRDTKKDEKIKSFLKIDKVDVAALSFFNQETIDWVIDIVRKHGLIIAMALPESNLLKLNFWKFIEKAITMRGSIGYSLEEFEESVEMVENETISAGELVTRMFPLSEVKEACEYKIKNNALKVILTN